MPFSGFDKDNYKELRKGYGPLTTITDYYHRDTAVEEVKKEDLMSGEESATTFRVGPYIVRSAKRIYKVIEPGYAPSLESPGDHEDVEYVRGHALLGYAPIGHPNIRITHEISAKYADDPYEAFKNGFKYITRAASARHFSWMETIGCICTLKTNPLQSDKDVRLLVLNSYSGSSFGANYWYGLTARGELEKLSFHDISRGKPSTVQIVGIAKDITR